MEEGLSLSLSACEEFVDGVASRDVKLNDSVWVRIFLPQALPHGGDANPKPVVLHTHGGAYSYGAPDWHCFHTFCSIACKLSHSIWISVAYRLAPAHRLPAAYDDAFLALRWLREQALQQQTDSSDPWLSRDLADFSKVLLAGESAGANIALKTAMDAAAVDLQPLCIKALLLIQPGFHSEEKRGTVLDKVTECFYNGALPVGETLDYAPVNPMHHAAPPLTPLAAYPHIFISAATADFRYDMVIHFHTVIQEFCPHVELLISPGEGHAFHIYHPESPEAHRVRTELARFIQTCMAA